MLQLLQWPWNFCLQNFCLPRNFCLLAFCLPELLPPLKKGTIASRGHLPPGTFASRFFCLPYFLPPGIFASRNFCLPELLQKNSYLPHFVHFSNIQLLNLPNANLLLQKYWEAKVPGGKNAGRKKFQKAKVPGDKSTGRQKFRGGAKVPGGKISGRQKYREAKVPGRQ